MPLSAAPGDFAMSDYEPLDLSAVCNAGPEVYPPNQVPLTGAQLFHGLPFQIGPTTGEPSAASLIAFGEAARNEPLAIPVNAAARTVIFAHARLESEIAQGDLPGRVVAEYEFVWADGER